MGNPVRLTVAELAARLGGTFEGDGATPIQDVKPIGEAAAGDITFVANARYAPLLATTKASCVVLPPRTPTPPGMAVIRHENPYVAFAKLIGILRPQPPAPPAGVHAQATVSPEARLGKDVSVGAGAVVEAGAEIGDGAIVGALSYVGAGASIGPATRLYPRVVLYHGVTIGARCTLHAGAVVGADGFGYASDARGVHHKIPQVGTVVIEDDVEVGANTTIDRAVLGATRIGRGTKIDNLVMIAHNVEIGPGSIIVAQSGISGSTKLGHHVVIAAQAGLIGHLEIGDQAMVGGQSGVTKDVPAGGKVFGSPAFDFRESLKAYAILPKLPEMRRAIADLEKRLAEIEPRPA